jgi:tRNA dimethylallyltransferase
LIVVLGPTGAGKSELGLVLAEEFGGEIVNCDSIQVYRGLEIGSAKLPVAVRRRIPHHLIDIIDLDHDLTAGSYSRLAREVVSAIHHRGRVPIVVGGTGFYLRALLDGLSPAPLRNADLRVRLTSLTRRRPSALHRFLRRHEPKAAARIHPNDRQKLIRAIEMTWLANQPASAVQNRPRDAIQGIKTLKIGLNPTRSALYRRLDERAAWMFHNGLLAEVQALLDSGVSPDLKPFQALGYKQAVKFLSAQIPIESAIGESQAKTRQYAKRQLTWFRRELDVHWLHGFGSEESVRQTALELTRAFLN